MNYLELGENLENLNIVEFISVEETARCVYSGSDLILDIERSKIHKTESLPLRNTHNGQGVLVNTCTTTSVDTEYCINKQSPRALGGKFYMQPLIG